MKCSKCGYLGFKDVVISNVEFPLPATDAGLKLYPAPAGRPLRLRPTFPENPFNEETVTV